MTIPNKLERELNNEIREYCSAKHIIQHFPYLLYAIIDEYLLNISIIVKYNNEYLCIYGDRNTMNKIIITKNQIIIGKTY